MKAGPPLVHTFDLAHAGTGTVTVTKVEAGCGCLRQALGTNVLQPGEKTKLTLEVNTLTQPDGPNRWQVAVIVQKSKGSAHPPRPANSFSQITATLSRDIVVTPPAGRRSPRTGEASQILVVTDKRAKPLTVLQGRDLVAAPDAVEVAPAANATPEKPRAQSVTIKLAATAPTGHRDEVVVLYTDDAECPELRVPVRVLKRAAAAVTATPDAVSLRLAAGQTEGSALIQLRAPDGKAVSVSAGPTAICRAFR